MTRLHSALILMLLPACGDKGDEGAPDGDADGWASDVDCDDADPAVHPEADEICDGLDNDCDGLVDDADDLLVGGVSVWTDGDGDGYGDPATSTNACEVGAGQVSDGSDCDDADASLHPDAPELCNGQDDDCDGLVDDDDTGLADPTTWYLDVDGDGFGSDTSAVEACVDPGGYLTVGGDCDDGNADAWPGAPEACDEVDQDCDGANGAPGLAGFLDTDGAFTDLTDTLAAGIDQAPVVWQSGSDGTLYLCEGTWYALLDLVDNVDVQGDGAELTILDGGDTETVVTVATAGQEVTLSRLTIQNGAGSTAGSTSRVSGGGAACTAAATLLLDSVRFTANDASAGYGGALFVNGGCAVTASDSTFDANTARYGGAIGIYTGSLTLNSSTVDGNSSIYDGGGIYGIAAAESAPTSIDLQDSTVSHNSGRNGGGLYIHSYTSASCLASEGSGAFHANTADSGGAIYLNGSTPTLYVEGYDMGVDGSADDNTPSDVRVDEPNADYDYEENATFACDTEDGCY